MTDRAARIADLEADDDLDKAGATELRVLRELRDSQEELRAWWEAHSVASSFWDYTTTQGDS
ncbi:MAG TPA: hypothetical protein VLW50_33985 [Streptosporangiaceae bacterium]|nr:hypothetical protein [Streptosporangiaceae bacterium]